MNEGIKYYLSNILHNGEASAELIKSVQANIDFTLPEDYISLMKEFNGLEADVGENGYLILWPIETLVSFNNNFDLLMKKIPDYFLFGQDAADTGYAFHKQRLSYHAFGFMSDFNTDPIEFCGDSFTEFLIYLYNQ
jgi:hypothetical protein